MGYRSGLSDAGCKAGLHSKGYKTGLHGTGYIAGSHDADKKAMLPDEVTASVMAAASAVVVSSKNCE